VGLQVKRFTGVGPLVQIAIPRVPAAKIWVIPSYDFEFNNSSIIIGVGLDL